jgi:hypothetical protein
MISDQKKKFFWVRGVEHLPNKLKTEFKSQYRKKKKKGFEKWKQDRKRQSDLKNDT